VDCYVTLQHLCVLLHQYRLPQIRDSFVVYALDCDLSTRLMTVLVTLTPRNQNRNDKRLLISTAVPMKLLSVKFWLIVGGRTFKTGTVERAYLLCDLVARVPCYKAEMYSVSCEVRTEFIYVM
jgi:DNA polymerase IIIc chi subunit